MEGASLKIKPSENNTKAQFIYSGELTIDNIDDIVEETITALNDYEIIEIITKNVKNIDLTFVQFISSFDKTRRAKDKNVTYSFNFEDEIKQLLMQAGFEKLNENITK